MNEFVREMRAIGSAWEREHNVLPADARAWSKMPSKRYCTAYRLKIALPRLERMERLGIVSSSWEWVRDSGMLDPVQKLLWYKKEDKKTLARIAAVASSSTGAKGG